MSRVSGGEALARILHAEGAEYVFGIPGATEAPLIDVLQDHPELRYVLCLHEVVAVGMAEGYARVSGRPGVLNLHTGTGLAAGMPLLSNAYQGRVPLVVTAGQQDTRLLAEDPAMSDDLVRIAAPFTKWGTEVLHAEDLPTVLRRAFKVATTPPMGPVLVSLPLDVLAGEFELEYEPGPRTDARLRPAARAVEDAAALLAGARDPVMVVEDGVARCDALDEVVRLAELTGARVCQQWMSDVNFPVDHPLYLGDLDTNSPATRKLLGRADVLVAVGARLFQQAVPTPLPLVPPTVRIVQVDDDPWEIGKNFPVAVGVLGDIKAALDELCRALEGLLGGDSATAAAARAAVAARTQAVAAEKREQEAAFARRTAAEWDAAPIAATRLAAELRDALAPGAVVVDDCWSYSAVLRRALPFDEPRSYLRSRAGGSIGAGLPMALGAKLAAPEQPVVCVSGDGSAMWSVQSLWNAAHDALPVTFVVLSNGCYRQVRLMKAKVLGAAAGGRTLGTDLCPPRLDFCGIAAGMGVAARRVTEPGELRGALREALAAGAPYLLDVAVDAAL